MRQTAGDNEVEAGEDDRPTAGVLVVWSGEAPQLLTVPVPSAGLILGRETLAETGDDRLSRQHARIRWNGTRFQVADLGSRNGTFVGGSLVADGEITALPPVVVRTGRTISVLCADVEPYQDGTVASDGAVVGPTLRLAWDAVERAARGGRSMVLSGERGAGKQLAARRFHAASGAVGTLVAVDCGAIASGSAGRLLFGGRPATGADGDADGYFAAADGGTLFLDEITELDLQTQARLARLLDAGEQTPSGAARPQLRLVVATDKDLRAEVQAGRFREDLYARIGRPEVRIPPLRDRVEEIPWLVAAAVRPSGLPAHPSLVEACLLRPWPGNVRELMSEVGRAAQASLESSRKAVRAEDLDGTAGRLLASGELQTIPPGARIRPTPAPEPSAILDALRAEGGSVSRAARRLGLHRNQLLRYLSKVPEAAALVSGEPDDDDASSPNTIS